MEKAIFILFFIFGSSAAKTVSHVFNINYIEGSPDGVYKQKYLGINGKFPGPTIELELGDTLEVDVVNLIQDGQNTSIHWHGIHQKGSLFEDGTSQISQCPLPAGYVQRYKFQVHQPGTYWYHSHVNSQYTEGLWGALIVHNVPEVYSYDSDLLLTVNDWYHRTAHENEIWHLSVPSRGVPPYPDSGLLNGLGRYPCDMAAKQARTCDPAKQLRPVFELAPNQTVRVRVINTSAVAAFNFSIDGHVLEAIEVDGIDVASPVPCDVAVIAAAQRYSFLIRTNNSQSDRFLIRAAIRTESLMLIQGVNINQYPEALMPDVTGVLKYSYTPSRKQSKFEYSYAESHSYLDYVPPATGGGLANYLQEKMLSPFDAIPAPPTFDVEFVLEAGFYEDGDNIRRGAFNEHFFQLPHTTPLLFQLVEGRELPKACYPIEVNHNDIVQVVINNPFYGPHPFHMHGHHFYVLGTGLWGEGNYSTEVHGPGLTLDGAKRDTVVVEEMSWAVIRFVADNPGVWTFHCHIDWHNLSGMALTFIVGKEQMLKSYNDTIPEEAKRVCALHNVRKNLDESNGGNLIAPTFYMHLLLIGLFFIGKRVVE